MKPNVVMPNQQPSRTPQTQEGAPMVHPAMKTRQRGCKRATRPRLPAVPFPTDTIERNLPSALGSLAGMADDLRRLLRYDPTDVEWALRGSVAEDPECELRVAVLVEALHQSRHLAAHRTKLPPKEQYEYVRLRAWWFSPDRSWPYACLPLLEALAVDPQPVRAYIRALMPPHDVSGIILPGANDRRFRSRATVDWRQPRYALADRVWAWALEHPGPWRVREVAAALGASVKSVFSVIKWPVDTGRMRRVVPGVYELVREG